MLTEGELDGLEGSLNTFKLSNIEYVNTLQSLTEKYEHIINDYRRLKSDYEEARESREKYKRLAREQERNPFVLLLVDGDGYLFKEQLIRNGGDGGVDAAQLLHREVKECLPRLGSDVDQCRVMVRIYANLQGLSKALARVGQAGNEARSLAPFTSNFTRAQELFDFVDAGDKKEGADFKIREIFRLFIENSQCRHIFFAGCHDGAYVSMLTPYINKMDRITLIKGAGFRPDYATLGLRIEEFPSVFRSVPLEGWSATASRPTPTLMNVRPLAPIPSPPEKKEPPLAKKTCVHFLKGNCRFGRQCNFAHLSPDGRDVRENTNNFNGFAPINPIVGPFPPTNGSSTPPVEIILQEPMGIMIPLNKDGMRLDTALPRASQEEWGMFNRRVHTHKLCNSYQLTGACSQEDCPFDHKYMEPELLNVLRHVVREYPCTRRGACRKEQCNKGHICTKMGCKGCKMGSTLHNVDARVFEWVAPEDTMEDRSPVGSELASPNGVSLDAVSQRF